MVNGWETAKKTKQIKEQGQGKKKTGKKPGGMKRGRTKKQEIAEKPV